MEVKNNKNIYQKLFEVKKVGIKLQRDTKAFNYKYVTLSQIQEKLGEVLQEQELLIIHRIENNLVVTEIIDIKSEDNECGIIQSSIQMSEGTKAQDKGSEITYFKRYNLLSLLDLEVEDDDGKKAQDSVKAKAPQSHTLDMHQCLKCGVEVKADIFEGKYGKCFKCPECNGFSKPNPIETSDIHGNTSFTESLK